ncbi:hypothetical protein Tco_0466227 [Tanacetum coccineum]
MFDEYIGFKAFNNDGIKLSKLKINIGFINGLPKKWLSFCQSLRNTNHVKDFELASLCDKLQYEENLYDSIYETKKKKSLTTATPLSTIFISTSIVQYIQDSPDDEEDTISSQEYMNELEMKFHERALLAKSKSFKIHLMLKVKNQGLIAEAYEWDEEEVSSNDNEIVEFDEKRGIIFNSNKEVVMIAPRVKDVYVLDMTSSTQESCFFDKASEIYIHNHKDHLGKFDEKDDDGYFLGYSLVSKSFRVFNTRRKQTKETFHITFNESTEAIKFSKPSVHNITIVESERYPPDEYLHHFKPSQRYQVDRNVVQCIESYERPEPIVTKVVASLNQNDQPVQTDEILNDDQSEHSNHTNDEHIIDNLTNTKDV